MAYPRLNAAPPRVAMRRGPTFCRRGPATAAETPRKKIARAKIHATCEFDQPNPESFATSMAWKKLHAYTVPRQSCSSVPMAAISQRFLMQAVLPALRWRVKVSAGGAILVRGVLPSGIFGACCFLIRGSEQVLRQDTRGPRRARESPRSR